MFSVQRQQVELRLNVFNLFNVVNLANPTTSISSANFGKIHVGTTGTAAGVLGQPRLLELAIRYTF